MKSFLATEERHKSPSTLVPLADRWIAPNWSLNFDRNAGLRPRNQKRCRTARRVPDDGAHRDYFTLAEHLWVQKQIEKRAYELWREGGGRQDTPLSNWLQAEDEVVREFCLSRQLSSAAPP